MVTSGDGDYMSEEITNVSQCDDECFNFLLFKIS